MFSHHKSEIFNVFKWLLYSSAMEMRQNKSKPTAQIII